MADFVRLKDTFNAAAQKAAGDRAALRQQREPLAARVTAFAAEKPEGLWQKLSHVFRKVSIWRVSRKIRKLDGQISAVDKGLDGDARETYRHMGEAALANLVNGGPFRENYSMLQETRGVLRQTDAALANAIDECGSASTMKMVDAFSDNKGISILSWLQTRSASKTIGQAQAQLQQLEKKLAQAPKIAQDLGDGVSFNNNMSLILDMIGGIGGSFGDWMAMSKLDGAANQMRDVRGRLGGIDGEIQKGMDNILSMAVSVMRRGDASMDALAQQLTPHLPRDVAEGMKPKAPGFNL